MPTLIKPAGPGRYWLSVSSYRGIAPGATHWYGRVSYYAGGKIQEWSVGDNVRTYNTQFGSVATLRRAAVAWFKRNAVTGGSLLTVGSMATLDPQEMLAGPKRLLTECNALWRRFEKLNGWDAPKEKHDKVQQLCDAWELIIRNHWKAVAARRPVDKELTA